MHRITWILLRIITLLLNPQFDYNKKVVSTGQCKMAINYDSELQHKKTESQIRQLKIFHIIGNQNM